MIKRRDFLMMSGIAAAAGCLPEWVSAKAPVAATQLPGFYRFNLGQYQITVVSDGSASLPVDRLFTAQPAERDQVLAQYAMPNDKLVLQLNALVVNTGDRLVLIDSGTRGRWDGQPASGRMLRNLEAAGIKRDDMDIVVISHGHPDHLWGVMSKDNDVTFPNAEYVFGDTELNFWTQPNHPLSNTGWGGVVTENNKTFSVVKDRIRTIKTGEDVVTGIRSVALPGHTPGQIGLQITSGGESLLTTADSVNNHVVGFEYPDWGVGYDLDVQEGVKTRRSLLDRAATDKMLLSSYHMPFPGIGRVGRAGNAYRWLPLDIQWQINTPT